MFGFHEYKHLTKTGYADMYIGAFSNPIQYLCSVLLQIINVFSISGFNVQGWHY